MRWLLALVPSLAYADLPPPTAAAAHEDVPAGATCRIGSDRLPMSRNYGEVMFSEGKLVTEGLGTWNSFDATTGKPLEEFTIGQLAGGISEAATCVAAQTDTQGRTELFKLIGRKSVARRQLTEGAYDKLVPADDCNTTLQRQGYRSACVAVLDAGLEPRGQLCAGKELAASAISGDGKRIALAPSMMDEKTYTGDGIHLYDAATLKQTALIPRTGEHLGTVALSRDAVAFLDGDRVRVWRGKDVAAFPVKAEVKRLVFSPSGKRLAIVIGGDDKQVAVIDTTTGAQLFVQHGLPDIGAVRFRDDELVAYAVGSGFRVVGMNGEDRIARGRLFQITGLALSPDGERAVISSAGHLSVWNAHDCTLVKDFAGAPLSDVVTTPDKQLAIGFTRDGLVRVDLTSGKRTAVALHGTFDSSAITTDGKLALVGMESEHQQQVVVVDLATMAIARKVGLAKVGMIGAMLVTPTDALVRAIAAGGLENGDTPTGGSTLFVLDPATGKLGKQQHLDSAAQHYTGAIVDGGVIVNGQRFDKLGKQLPRPEWSHVATSSDGATLLWGDDKHMLAWPAAKPLPTAMGSLAFSYGRSAVGVGVALTCSDQSCVIAR